MTGFTKHKYFLPGLFLSLAVFYTLPFLLKLTYWGVRDWDLFITIAAVPADTIIRFGQFPFWNPYTSGGDILFHHPEVAVLSPFMLLYILFGAVVGLKLQVLICYFLGFWGTQRLCRSLGMSTVASVIVAVAYYGSVHFALHFAEGHMPFTHFCFLPWFLSFLLVSRSSPGHILAAGLMLALMILGNGAAVPLLYTLFFSLLLMTLLAIREKHVIRLRDWLLSVLVGISLSAVKVVPMLVYLVQGGWQGRSGESIPLGGLSSIFFGLNHSLWVKNFPGQIWSWHEYGAYISPLLVILAIVALVYRFRQHALWAVLAVFFLLLGLGNFGWFSPWAILSHLPGFGSSRCTGRAFQFVILSVAILGGFGYDLIREKFTVVSEQRWRYIPVYLLSLVAAVIVLTNMALVRPIMNDVFRIQPEEVVRSPFFRHTVEGPQSYKNFLANRGSLVAPWLSGYHQSRGLVDANDNVLSEQTLSGKMEVLKRDYTPNRIEYEIVGLQPGEMVISMGYDPGWHASDGRLLFEKFSLLAFGFQADRQKVVLHYSTPFFIPGIVISLISLAGCLIIWRRAKIKHAHHL